MTIFSPADIPGNVDSLEKLSVWSGVILNDLYSGVTVIEAPSTAQIVATAYPYFIDAADPDVWRLIMRQSIELAPSWRRGGKIWTYAQSIGSQAIPQEYKTI